MKKIYAFSVIYCFILTAIMLTISVGAYLDPSVISYTVTAIAALAISCGAFFLYWFKKMRKKVSKTLGIDENKNKEVEEEIKIVADDKSDNDKTN